jgi:adenine/guanine phosphoribosyltransferase-like PRPP-binding protein
MKRPRIEIAGDRHMETLANCDGYYECPRSDGTGERLGPLVGYAGTYEGPDGKPLQYVGEIYANFAKAEPYPHVLKFFAGGLVYRLFDRLDYTGKDEIVFCGAPIGGYSLADAMAFHLDLDLKVIKAEKMVTAVKTATSREMSDVVFSRHVIEPGQSYVIVEDVCNNFSTTAKLIKLIMSYGGKVVAIVCFLNRSLTVDNEYCLSLEGQDNVLRLPVVSLVRQPIQEWRQDDPAVTDDIARKNVVWKPKDKDEWARLKKAMHGVS